MKEEWKLLLNTDYEVSNRGRVRRVVTCRQSKAGKILALSDTGKGYLSVALWSGGTVKRRYIHQLVAEQFIGPYPPGKEVNHDDGDKSNNHVSNLEYVTRTENALHAFRTGLRTGPTKHPQATVDAIRFMCSGGMSAAQAARETGVSHSQCLRIVRNETRTPQS